MVWDDVKNNLEWKDTENYHTIQDKTINSGSEGKYI